MEVEQFRTEVSRSCRLKLSLTVRLSGQSEGPGRHTNSNYGKPQ
jgi:hypothetical protein